MNRYHEEVKLGQSVSVHRNLDHFDAFLRHIFHLFHRRLQINHGALIFFSAEHFAVKANCDTSNNVRPT